MSLCNKKAEDNVLRYLIIYSIKNYIWHVERAFRKAKSKIEKCPMFHFTRKRIEAHICICFVALKVYKGMLLYLFHYLDNLAALLHNIESLSIVIDLHTLQVVECGRFVGIVIYTLNGCYISVKE